MENTIQRLPIVAFIGKPNVGKSSLFNRCVGKRIAITSHVAGTTRDRIFGKSNWRGKDFFIVDNAGYETESEIAEFGKNIKSQIDVSIKEADVVVFVVDGKEGLEKTDLIIAEILRKSGAKIILAANKCEGKQYLDNMGSFQRIGFGEPIIVSAIHGKGVAEMLDEVVANFEVLNRIETEQEIPRIVIVGRPNVGKSTLVNYLTGENRVVVSDVPGTTRDVIDTMVELDKNWFLLSDTAGVRKRGSIVPGIEKYSVMRAQEAIKKSDLVIALIDATEGPVRGDVHIITYALESGKPVIIAINKTDLINVNTYPLGKFPFMSKLPRVFISAKTGQNVGELLKLIYVTMKETKKVV